MISEFYDHHTRAVKDNDSLFIDFKYKLRCFCISFHAQGDVHRKQLKFCSIKKIHRGILIFSDYHHVIY